MTSTTPVSAGRGAFSGDGWTPRLVLSLISLVCLAEAVAFVTVSTATALPKIIDRFHTTQGGWLLTAFTLVGAVSAPLIGKLADLYGKRRMITVVILLAVLGELLGAIAPGFSSLIVGYVLLGTLPALLFLPYSLIRDIYPKKLVPFCASVSVTGMGILVIGAPFVVGFLIDHFGFRAVYVFNLAWLVVMGAIMLLTTPETSLRHPTRIDALGALMLSGGATLILLPISMGEQWGWGSARVIGLLAGGVVVLAVYVAVSLRTREPVLDLRALVRRTVLFGSLGGGAANGALPAFTTLLAFLAMTPRQLGGTYGLGMTATKYALVTAPFSLGGVAAGVAVGVLVKRTGPRPLMYAGLSLFTVGALFLAFDHDTFGKLLAGVLVVGVGYGLAVAAMPNMIMEGASASEQGSMSSVGGLVTGLIAASASVVVFAIMAPTAKSPAPGVLIYGDSGISTSLLIITGVVFVPMVIGAILLRPRQDRAAEKRATAFAQETTLPT